MLGVKMSYDGFVTGAIVRELQQLIIDGKIEKIYQPEADELILHIHKKGTRYRLYISVNSGHARLHLIEKDDYSNPKNPMSFCMLARKHFQGGRIVRIEQIDSERIIEICVNRMNELGDAVEKKLIIEIMGKHSNIIALDSSTGKILDSIKRITLDVNRYRQLLPGLPYVSPPSHGKVAFYTLTEEELASILDESSSLKSKALLSNIQGISPGIADEICIRASQRFNVDLELLTFKELYPILKEMTDCLQSYNITPVVYFDDDKNPIDFHVFTLYTKENFFDKKSFNSPSEAADYYYHNKVSSNRVNQKSLDLIKTIDNNLNKLYLKKQRLSEDILKAKDFDNYRLYGELLTANLHKIGNKDKSVKVLNYYDNKEIDIPLDTRLSPSKNAQKYFRRYNKLKTAIKEKNIQLDETNQYIEYLESVLTFAKNADTVEDLEGIRQELIEGGYLRNRKSNVRRTESKPKPLAFTSSDGFRILVGRNNKENDLLTFKIADKTDIWFHTKDIPGSHVILILEGKKPSDTSIYEAASIAAYYSKARSSENVAVDYTLVKYVKKPSGAKPGMVIFTDNSTVYVSPSLVK
jgi:predicted ribosome quality control (RQC) complex YloA/Tae2 family protein